MVVYRVENADGFGPYTFRDGHMTPAQAELCLEIGERHGNCPAHPGPRSDKGWRENPKAREFDDSYRFGFTGLDQMVAWFRGWGVQLRDTGFTVTVARVPIADVIEGSAQCAFIGRGMVPLRHFDPVALIP